MTMQAIIITIIAAIISGLLATILTLVINKWQQNLKGKRDLIDDIFGYRYQMTGTYASNNEEFSRAMNRIPIIFHRSAKVLNAYNDFYEATENTQVRTIVDDKLVNLLKEMCRDAKIKCTDWNDSVYKRVFVRQKNN